MNIIIIVHSSTGTTRKFADRIADRLKEGGHNIKLTQIETDVPIKSGTVRSCAKFVITNLPDIKEYDAILLGGPVWGFSASPVIIACINALDDLKGKKVLPFVTMGFPFKFMGGNQAIGMMSRNAADKKATVLPGVSVSKLFHDIEGDMDKAAASVSSVFKSVV
jgi:flavodoxin